MVKCLLEEGADASKTDARGMTALAHAAHVGKIYAVRVLLKAKSVGSRCGMSWHVRSLECFVVPHKSKWSEEIGRVECDVNVLEICFLTVNVLAIRVFEYALTRESGFPLHGCGTPCCDEFRHSAHHTVCLRSLVCRAWLHPILTSTFSCGR